jgi:hypothetical protein
MNDFVKKTIFSINGINVNLVDGEYVRNHISDEFIGGGNHHAYPYVHENEYWIEEVNARDEKKFTFFTLIHEMWEEEYMQEFGMEYLEAHEFANMIEQRCRNAMIDVDIDSTTADGMRTLLRTCSQRIGGKVGEWLAGKYMVVKD